MGVFATRSPFRPNRLGLSCLELLEVRQDRLLGPVLTVGGGDLLDGTPIYDIKPYLPYADCRPEALELAIPPDLLERVPPDRRKSLRGVLAQDPRPSYQSDPERIYGAAFGGLEVRFRVSGEVLTVLEVSPKN